MLLRLEMILSNTLCRSENADLMEEECCRTASSLKVTERRPFLLLGSDWITGQDKNHTLGHMTIQDNLYICSLIFYQDKTDCSHRYIRNLVNKLQYNFSQDRIVCMQLYGVILEFSFNFKLQFNCRNWIFKNLKRVLPVLRHLYFWVPPKDWKQSMRHFFSKVTINSIETTRLRQSVRVTFEQYTLLCWHQNKIPIKHYRSWKSLFFCFISIL